jgi:hypothetical protein
MQHFAATVVSDPDTGELLEQFTRNLLRLPRESILEHVDAGSGAGHQPNPQLGEDADPRLARDRGSPRVSGRRQSSRPASGF